MAYIYRALNEFINFGTYRMAIAVRIITILFSFAIQYFFWKSIYSSSSTIGNFDFQKMINYIIVSTILSSFLSVGLEVKVGKLIQSGNIINYLIKPISFEKTIFSEALGRNCAYGCLVSLPFILVITAFSLFDFDISMTKILFSIISISLAFLFTFFFELSIGYLSFYTKSIWSLTSIKVAVISMLSGQLIPFEMYPHQIRDILEKLPFRSSFQIPIEIISYKNNISYTVSQVSIQLFWVLIIYVICLIIGKKAFKKLEIQGG